jgi:hypothetical protein
VRRELDDCCLGEIDKRAQYVITPRGEGKYVFFGKPEEARAGACRLENSTA